jgi:glycosyltransferase involved in cell wall biosynthesis
MNIIITAPSLNSNHNVSGISSVTNFIIEKNPSQNYIHFEIGKRDSDGRGLSRVLNILKSYFKWFFLLMKTKDKLVHFNLPLDAKSVIRDCPLVILTRFFGVRIVIHVHGGAYILNDDIPSWAKFLLKLSFAGNNPKIVLGDAEKVFLEATFQCKNVDVLANSLSLDGAQLFDRTPKNELKLLFLGRISKEKGLTYIYEAFKTLKEKHHYTPDFYMAGKGEDEAEYVSKFGALLDEKFHFKGVVFGDEKTELLKSCNVFLLPSFFEGLPISLLEAMSFGQIPVVTKVGSIKYVVEDEKNGLYVNVKNSEDIINAVLEIRNNSELQANISKSAKETIFKNFNPQDYIRKLNLIYGYE